MRRRAKPAKAKVEGKRPPARTSPKADAALVRDLEMRLAEALKGKAEALEHQTATSEVLRVISSSPTDVRPVFHVVAESAARLCDSFDAAIYRREADRLVLVGYHGQIGEREIGVSSLSISRGTGAGRAVLEGRAVHVLDMQAEMAEFPESSANARRRGFRTLLSVPLMKDGLAIGAIVLLQTEARLFKDQQIALLQTFADQAVIAIENVRLFNETKEALEQQTATSEILQAISGAQTDAQPVFNAIARSTVRLCDAARCAVWRPQGDLFRCVARCEMTSGGDVVSLSPEGVGVLEADSLPSRVIHDRQILQVNDVPDNPAVPPKYREMARIGGYRSLMAVPMVHEGVAVGVITVVRPVSAEFTDQQIRLVKTFADQAVIAIENVRLFTELQTSNRELSTALHRQTATSEILRVISRSQTDLQPVFDTILTSAVRLLRGHTGTVTRLAGDQIDIAALTSVDDTGDASLRALFPQSLRSELPHAQAIRRRAPINIADTQSDPGIPEPVRVSARARGYHGWVTVPMLRQDEAVGTIAVTRSEAGGFTDEEIALLQTFADQAVIAIENVRLFTETKEGLERQTATSEILQVISRSPTDVQPVFDTIAERAMRLCSAAFGIVVTYDGELLHLRALANVQPEGADALRKAFPLAPSQGSISGRVILTGDVAEIPDVLADPGFQFRGPAGAAGFRCGLGVPMLNQGRAVGVVIVSRPEPGEFSEEQIQLLRTFADQAVIAIVNVRLFTELQDKNRALTEAHAQVTEALDQQTATSEILRAIAHVQTDVQPVFDTIVQSAARLFRATTAGVFLTDGRMVYLPANHGNSPEALTAARARYPRPLDMDTHPGMAILTRSVLHVPDIEEPAVVAWVRETGRLLGVRSSVTVPMLRETEAVGAINVSRPEPGRFADTEIALLKTFADQAVIAVENVRLFRELEARTHDLTRSVGELRALGEVGQAISSTLDLQTVLRTIVAQATELSGTDAGVIYEYDEPREVFVPRATERLEDEIVETMLATPVRKGEGATGQLAAAPRPVQLPDILAAPAESRVRGALVRAGYRALLAVPLVREGRVLGGLTVLRKGTGAFAPEIVELLQTFATQSALAIQNARLFLEIADKSRQLEAASQHKSEFLANMSHELRTPLNAILGFSEVLAQGMFGPINEKQTEYLRDILDSGRHLLSLINDILDLSKIEAGRMELELSEFDLPQAIQNALTLVRERALRRGIALHYHLDDRIGTVHADERKVKQVLLNLLSNAIKFTPEGGRIEVRAAPADGLVEVSVADTGIGIAPEDLETVFEEFRQVGTADKKAEGTGLGLALAKKFIELHGGRIWVESEPDRGSTFTFTLPVTHD